MDVTSGHSEQEFFSADPAGLAEAKPAAVVDLADGATFDLVAGPVRKRLGHDDVRMLAYNGSVPGATLRVRQGATVTVNFTNKTDMENTVHWHGIRLENRFDGTHETQRPVPIGGTFSYRIRVPDPGAYWYHPHIREDYGQEMGLYGAIVVVPSDPEYWPQAHREVTLTLDDILIEDGKIAPFSRTETTFAAMGRYGNTFLVNGEVNPGLSAKRGEIVRFYLINTANTRTFNVGVPGARIKLVGADSGRVEQEEFVDSVVLAPSERVVIDVHFPQPGRLTLDHRTPERTVSLATINVGEEPASPSLEDQFSVLRHNPEWVEERQRIEPYVTAQPDKVLAFVAEMDMDAPAVAGEAVVYTCPMHPEIVSQEPGRCPKCGMYLQPKAAPEAAATYTCPMHPEVVSTEPGKCPKCGMKLLPTSAVAAAGHDTQSHHGSQSHGGHGSQSHGGGAHSEHSGGHSAHHGHGGQTRIEASAHAGHDQAKHPTQHGVGESHAAQGHGAPATEGIEWEDDMFAINRMTTPANMRWKLVDKKTGAEGHAIDWTFRVGDRVKIRLVNETESDHPMQHPFHIHGAGRFVVLARDGETERNLAWKDTVLVRTGQTVDLLLEVTNPGVWMAHCHIAEHHESGMMLSFRVTE